jgi:predicted nucleic acid-binding protein
VIVDTSVVLAWFVEGPRRAAAMDLLRSGPPLVAPDVLAVELATALRHHVADGRLPGAAAAAVLTGLLDGPVALVATTPLLLRAMRTADRVGVTVPDACHVVLAQERGVPLITADDRLARAVRFGGLDVEVRTLG